MCIRDRGSARSRGELGAVALDRAFWWTWASWREVGCCPHQSRERRWLLVPGVAPHLVGRLEGDLVGR
eukprot:15475116-Alexandrium_andersonii.AAC.1